MTKPVAQQPEDDDRYIPRYLASEVNAHHQAWDEYHAALRTYLADPAGKADTERAIVAKLASVDGIESPQPLETSQLVARTNFLLDCCMFASADRARHSGDPGEVPY